MKSEKEMSILESIEKIGGRAEDYLYGAILRIITTDYSFFTHVLADLISEERQNLHEEVLNYDAVDRFEKAMSTLGLTEIRDLESLVRVVGSIYNDDLQVFSLVEKGEHRIVAEISMCPVVQFTQTQFGEKKNCPYFQSVANAEEKRLDLWVNTAGMNGTVRAFQQTFACKHDESCRLVFEKIA